MLLCFAADWFFFFFFWLHKQRRSSIRYSKVGQHEGDLELWQASPFSSRSYSPWSLISSCNGYKRHHVSYEQQWPSHHAALIGSTIQTHASITCLWSKQTTLQWKLQQASHQTFIRAPNAEKLLVWSCSICSSRSLESSTHQGWKTRRPGWWDPTKEELMALAKHEDVEDWVYSCEKSSDDEASYDTDKDQPKSGDTSVEPLPAKVRAIQVDSSLSAELEQSLVFREYWWVNILSLCPVFVKWWWCC